jgi:hypothetical protein
VVQGVPAVPAVVAAPVVWTEAVRQAAATAEQEGKAEQGAQVQVEVAARRSELLPTLRAQ